MTLQPFSDLSAVHRKMQMCIYKGRPSSVDSST